MSGVLCDTSGLIALFDASESANSAVSEVIDGEDGPFIVSPFVLAELDYLLATRRGVQAELAALHQLASGAWELPCLSGVDLSAAAEIVERYADQEIGVADASLVVLARRYRTLRILTLDHRHFSVLRSHDGSAFELLPAA